MVEGVRFEIESTLTGTAGSNPVLSATEKTSTKIYGARFLLQVLLKWRRESLRHRTIVYGVPFILPVDLWRRESLRHRTIVYGVPFILPVDLWRRESLPKSVICSFDFKISLRMITYRTYSRSFLPDM